MARALVLGNGEIEICLDNYGRVRDFYYPFVGLQNHVGGNAMHRLALSVDDKVTWLDDASWNINVDYHSDTLASYIIAKNEDLRIELNFTDVVYNEKNIFIRNILVTNHSKEIRNIKIFFHQQFKIDGVAFGDTGFYEPDRNVVIHYKGRRVFLIGGRYADSGIKDYSIGLFGIENREGTWKDIEDGVLSKNPIEHGAVDSAVSFEFQLTSEGREQLHYWIVVGDSLEHAGGLHDYILQKEPEHLIETTSDFWNAWVNKNNFSFYGLRSDVVTLFKRSLLTIRTQMDNHGAIIASCDSDMLSYGRDTYAYMWPRDGAYVAMSLDGAGYSDLSKKFFQFCADSISTEGYLYHKYRPDMAMGSSWHPWVHDGKKQLAIQEDETALVLIALWRHYTIHRDLEFIESIYSTFISKSASFLMRYRDSMTGLPKSSYDLWEERYGISTYTTASVYGALMSAFNFAGLLGRENETRMYRSSAEEVRTALLKHLYDEENNYFYRCIYPTSNGIDGTDGFVYDKTIDASSFYGIYKFGVLSVSDARLKRAFDVYNKALTVKTNMGGIIRYEGDEYFKSGKNAPSNPWIITTLWMAQYHIARAKNYDDLENARKWFDWVVDRALPSGMLPEQLEPNSGTALSATPLSWSHSEFVMTVVQYLERLEALGICKACSPRV